ncbi:hypothetical protein [Streptomyces sp. 6-11-2]|uniref:hypothetical protein n=1 Tax=Streptomyces sp. 6-11-2 TaxID=2585753 RepID=UPI001C0EB7EC|nr:hypothetical protein [Streptomyces sp. 6-11-2]
MLTWLIVAVALLAGLMATTSSAMATDLPYGPYTCAAGYTWRDAYAGDQVCVTPAIRTQTATENSLGPLRREPNGGIYGPDTCRPGFVWRATRPSDHVCVPPDSRDQASSDNANAVLRLADPGATPRGGVSVTTELSPTGGGLFATGSGLTPYGMVRFYSAGTSGPVSLGRLTADATGTLQGWQKVAALHCGSGPYPATIVVLDQGTGLVTTAGTTDAFHPCY